ncbi:GNAT family N-acetyltransferase, partial [Alcaligenes pakistanensis]
MKDSDSGLHFIDCTEERHAVAILEILNEAIVNSTALYDYVPRPPEAMASWFA